MSFSFRLRYNRRNCSFVSRFHARDIMPDGLAEIALLEDVRSMPPRMQKIYLQLVSAIDISLQKLRSSGAVPEHISEEFIEELVNLLLERSLTRQTLQNRVDEEFQRQILEQIETTELTPAC